AGPATVVVLSDVWRGWKAMGTARSERVASTVKLLEYAQANGARVLVLLHRSQSNGTIPRAYLLPPDIRAAIRPDKLIATIGLDAFEQTGQVNRALRTVTPSGKTIIEEHLSGVRNLVLIGGEYELFTVQPMFEALWSGINVYRNELLAVTERNPSHSLYSAYFFKRLTQFARHANTEPLELPGFLPNDPFLHYVPIGSIPGVIDRWAIADNETRFNIRSDGTPITHIARDDPPTSARGYTGIPIAQNPFDLQVHVVLDGSYIRDDARREHMLNRERSALVVPNKDRLKAFVQRTVGMGSIGALADAFHAEHLSENTEGELKFDVARRFAAYDNGRVEVNIHGHGARGADEVYRVGGLSVAQLGTVIVEHDHVGLNARTGTNRATISHLNIIACGVRCNPAQDQIPGVGPDVTTDEVGFAQGLVRWLRDQFIDVERVTVANTSILVRESPVGEPSITWFMVRDDQMRPRYFIRESALLATSLRYDRGTDTFLPADDEVQGDALPVGLSEPVRAADHRDIDPRTGEAATGALARPADVMHVGNTLRAPSGATIDIVPAGDVMPRFDEPVSMASDRLWEVAYWAVQDHGGSLEPDVMITGADTFAIAMGMRVQDGPVVVVDTDPARMAGVQRVLALALESSTPLEWGQKIVAEGFATLGDLSINLIKLTENDVVMPEAVLADPGVVAGFERLKARAHGGKYIFQGADLATADGGAVVNAHVGAYPVRSIALPSDEHFLVQGARLGMVVSRTAYLTQLRENIALLAGPETHVHQGVFGQLPRSLLGEQAVRNHFGLAGAQPLAGASASSTPPASIAAGDIEVEIVNDARNTTSGIQGARGHIDAVEAGMRDNHTPMHRWWTSMRDRLVGAGEWLRRQVMQLLARLGLVHPSEAHTPAQSRNAASEDPLSLRIYGEGLGRDYSHATRRDLHAAGLSPHDWIPVLATADTEEERNATPCALSTPCVRTEDPDDEVQFVHEGTGEVRTLTVKDPVYAQTRQFMERMHEEAKVRAASPPVEGAHASTMNTAFALTGLLH
ncbi:MAG: hypothetical protein HOQ01_03265, partial [Lysobacter sp.]|nr:hypothetical protein [Lysobacter sp.]